MKNQWNNLKLLNSNGDNILLSACKICGVIQRQDKKNNPCKGPMKLRPFKVGRSKCRK